MSLEAFESFGEAARPAMPLMIEAVHGQHTGNILMLMRKLGPVAADAAPQLGAMLRTNDTPYVVAILEALKAIGPGASNALPDIEPLLTNSDPTVRMLAVTAKARITKDAAPAVPVLLDVLEGRASGASKYYVLIKTWHDTGNMVCHGPEAAAQLLGELGPGAHDALPNLEKRLASTSMWTRITAARSYWEISGDASKSLPVLIELLDAESPPTATGGSPAASLPFSRVIVLLEDMGPAAKPAIPALERVRPFSADMRRAVNEAMQSIQTPAR
jgi:hypothetical protein